MAMMNAGYSTTPITDSIRAKIDAKREKSWQDMLQAAALASKMNDQTALGFGLGSLLANNWDKWFGGSGKKNNSNSDGQYSFSANMATAQDPLQFAAAGGDPHAQWALKNNQPFSLMSVVQNPAPITARPMPDNLTMGGVDPQAVANAQPANNPMPMPTLTVDGNGVQGMNSGIFNTMNPANSDNFTKANGGFNIGGAWQMPNQSSEPAWGGTYDEWLKKFGGGR